MNRAGCTARWIDLPNLSPRLTSRRFCLPEIARAHHEKPNGKGYPFGLNSGQIPVQAKMMAICDIFDALSASDRPYKRAVPTNRALDILKLCARDEEIDAELLGVFLDAQIYRLCGKSSFKQPTADGVP